MKGCFSEERIALYIEGDLLPIEAAELQAHLRECGACREATSALQESQALFRSMRQEVVPPAALDDVRRRVMGAVESTWMLRLERILFAGLRWRYAIAGLLVIAMVSGTLWFRAPGPGRPAELPQQAAKSPDLAAPSSPAAPAAVFQEEKKPKPPQRRVKPQSFTPEPKAEPQQVVVKLLTDDPSIVIYWLIQENGGEQ